MQLYVDIVTQPDEPQSTVFLLIHVQVTEAALTVCICGNPLSEQSVFLIQFCVTVPEIPLVVAVPVSVCHSQLAAVVKDGSDVQ